MIFRLHKINFNDRNRIKIRIIGMRERFVSTFFSRRFKDILGFLTFGRFHKIYEVFCNSNFLMQNFDSGFERYMPEQSKINRWLTNYWIIRPGVNMLHKQLIENKILKYVKLAKILVESSKCLKTNNTDCPTLSWARI